MTETLHSYTGVSYHKNKKMRVFKKKTRNENAPGVNTGLKQQNSRGGTCKNPKTREKGGGGNRHR